MDNAAKFALAFHGRRREATLPPSATENDLRHALELLAVLRAWYRTPGDVEDTHRHHELFPLVAGGGIDMDKRPLWDAVDGLLSRHGIPQPGDVSRGTRHE